MSRMLLVKQDQSSMGIPLVLGYHDLGNQFSQHPWCTCFILRDCRGLTSIISGYPESLTDPSYRGQLLVFTQPLIGNYGVPSSARDENGLLRYFESPHIQAAGVVVADIAEQYSHWTAVESLGDWCTREGVPIISGSVSEQLCFALFFRAYEAYEIQ